MTMVAWSHRYAMRSYRRKVSARYSMMVMVLTIDLVTCWRNISSSFPWCTRGIRIPRVLVLVGSIWQRTVFQSHSRQVQSCSRRLDTLPRDGFSGGICCSSHLRRLRCHATSQTPMNFSTPERLQQRHDRHTFTIQIYVALRCTTYLKTPLMKDYVDVLLLL